jgi:SAM-dependent methyltransferase
MSSQEDKAPFKRYETALGVGVFILGIILVLIFQNTSFRDYGVRFGFILIAFGTGLIIWGLVSLISNSGWIGFINFMKRENLVSIFKDPERGKELITKSIREWAENPQPDTIKIKGVTLNIAFSNTGILTQYVARNKIINRDQKKIQVLLLNPYSMNAITRSIQESRPLKPESNPTEDICNHTLVLHKQEILYRDFERTVSNIKDMIQNSSVFKVGIECNVYSSASPNFLLINSKRAISENLILGRRNDEPKGKLYGILPHLVYGNGKIKESLEVHFDYLWEYDSIPLEDFHEEVEEKYYEINRLFLLYNVQEEIWDRQWEKKGRSRDSEFDFLYLDYKALYPDAAPPSRILDLGCGDGGGGSLEILKEHPNAIFDYVDISKVAIGFLQANIEDLEKSNRIHYHYIPKPCDMLTFLTRCEPASYSMIYANFSIIYMTKIKAIEIYRKIFAALQSGGVFMISLWTTNYFKMPVGEHGEKGKRPPHTFVRIPMTEDLRVLNSGPRLRIGEIRRFYRDFDELMEEFQSADEGKVMDFENIHYRYYESDAILRVWVSKK